MKRLFTLFVAVLWVVSVSAQDCYNSTRSDGIQSYNSGNYQLAKKQFSAAKTCPDIPMGHDLDTWIGKCDTAIQEAEQRRQQEQLERQRREQASKGYMNIIDVEFSNQDNDGNLLSGYGSTLTVSQVRYVTPRIKYNSLTTTEKSVKIDMKVYFANGTMSTGSSSPSGYTYSRTVTVKPGNGNYINLTGWGNSDGGVYSVGTHRFEFYYNGKKIYTKEFTIHSDGGGSGGSGNLKVDGMTAVNSTWAAGGGSQTYYVTSQGEWKVTLLPSWSRVSNQTSNSFTINWDANSTSGTRTDWFRVECGDDKVRVDVRQASTNPSGATYLKVDNKTEVNSSWAGTGGTETYYVSTDGNRYEVTLLPSWATVTSQTSTSFTIRWDNNGTGSQRTDWFRVKSGDYNVRVNITQAAGNSNVNATRLTVDGKSDATTSNWSAESGTETYYVNTDGTYQVTLLPSWVTVTSKSETQFTVRWESNNTGASRSDWFRVESGSLQVRVNVIQSSSNNPVSRKEWKRLMKKAVDNYTYSYNNGRYKGQTGSGGGRFGYGVYFWSGDEDFYWGRWGSNGNRNGIGIYMIGKDGYHILNCDNCHYYVGEYSNDNKSGKGTCYDKDGNLIYYGDFANDRPTGTYPSTESYSSYRFEILSYDGGDQYIGETKDGKRHGFGVYVWANGDAWYGPWTDGSRDGRGIYMYYNGQVFEGKWQGDTRTE